MITGDSGGPGQGADVVCGSTARGGTPDQAPLPRQEQPTLPLGLRTETRFCGWISKTRKPTEHAHRTMGVPRGRMRAWEGGKGSTGSECIRESRSALCACDGHVGGEGREDVSLGGRRGQGRKGERWSALPRWTDTLVEVNLLEGTQWGPDEQVPG